MAKRGRTSRIRRYYRSARARIRRMKPKIPLEVGIAGVTIPFTAPCDGWNSPINLVAQGDWNGLGATLAKGFIGIDPNGAVNIFGMLNPFDMSNGRYTKTLIYAGLISKIRKKLVHIPFEKVPLVGKYIS